MNDGSRVSETDIVCDALVLGAGPAGLAAAWRGASEGLNVAVVDDNPSPGGQIWRGEQDKPSSSEAQVWFERIASVQIRFIPGARIFQQSEPGKLLAETISGAIQLRYTKLVLATGARERFLPFPGWTLPNVMGAGGLQALVKTGFRISGKRIVIAGSGPLLLAVAAYLRAHGANVFFRFRLRHMDGNYTQSLPPALVAQLGDLGQIGFRCFRTDGPKVNECRMACDV